MSGNNDPDAYRRLATPQPTDEALREALEEIADLYANNNVRPATLAIRAGEIPVRALALSPDPIPAPEVEGYDPENDEDWLAEFSGERCRALVRAAIRTAASSPAPQRRQQVLVDGVWTEASE